MMVKTSTSDRPTFRLFHAAGLLTAVVALFAGQHLASAQGTTESALAQTPLFVSQGYPPLNMLVMGRDHKMYYEAYNDASDLDGDGVIDVGYKPDKIDYYGYFNNNACYTYDNDMFRPVAAATGSRKKQCDGTKWSGDFLNYLTTSRMDAMRRVLYGGTRNVDTDTSTVLQGSYIPRDAHSWGKAYDFARDGTVYRIQDYAPLAKPVDNTRHLFAVTTKGESGDNAIPLLRVLNDSKFQIWEWVSKEQPVAQDKCIDNGTSCEQGASSQYEMLPASAFQDLSIKTWKWSGALPANMADMNARFDGVAGTTACGTGTLSVINTTGANNNPFAGSNGCTNENYLTLITGKVYIPSAGTYRFAVDGDDSVDFTIGSTTVGWYGGHANNRSQSSLESHSNSFNFTTAGWQTFVFRHIEATADDNWGLAMQVTRPASAIVDKKIRVEACVGTDAALREETCKPYQNDAGTIVYKPTGLLHDFGENEKMYFGLLTGSYQKNIAGGTLRRNVSKFTSEVNPKTGQFITPADGKGIVANIDGQKAIGFNGSTYNNCGWITDGPISAKSDPSICAMWGNPMAEMMFETLRYFAGATAAHATYDYGSGSSKDKDLGLSKPEWKPPYSAAAGGGGYLQCARPVMTVLSDINPSYDSKIPGSRYNSIAANAADLGAFDVSGEVDAIGAAEGIHGKKYFIGQSTSGNADAAPTVKTVDALSWVRGLSPQEPSKEGTYYAAGVSRFAANNFLFGNAKGKNRLMTYSVAIASPLPEIRFPVGDGRFVTIAPYAKSVTGSGIDNTKFAPTNQIVDYYVDRIANTGVADKDTTVNGGRPYAEFRINYEDVEQGADHDMDAISRYTVALQADNTVKIDMVSEYAAGGIGQHQGYVISGTTKDGMYLDVRDKDTASVFYALNTPQGRDPGYCMGRSNDPECISLGLTSSRVFTPSASSSSGTFLKDPLWYAAKYGMPGRDPATVKGDPDNYFLVTNATTLKAQMTKAFNDIVQNTNSVTAVSVDVPEGTIAAGADLYRTRFEAEGWVGDVIRERLTDSATGLNYVRRWSAADMLSNRGSARKIYYAGAGVATPTLREFTYTVINGQTADAAWKTALNINPATNTPDGKAEQRIAFLRGEDDTLRVRKKLTSGRSNILGDIVNSSPVRVNGALYRASAADGLEGTAKYGTFVSGQASTPEMIYVGANDGMLHAFRAETGEEEFAFIPTAVRPNLNLLTASNYGVKDGIEHRYYVDGTPTVSDVYFGDAWHKVLIGSLGAGGRAVFAMDITDPTAPKLLWEFGSAQQNNMGNSLAQPTIARMNDPSSGKGKWVALVPNGYQGGNSLSGNGGASLFVLDIADGSVLRRLDVDAGATSAELGTLGNGLSRVSAVDGNGDGKVDMAYAGDLMGNVWRFDMRSGDISAWTVQKLYTAKDANGARQPITAAPYVIGHPLGRGDLVMFGTGRLLTATDKISTQRQSVYGIWDRYAEFNAAAPSPLPTANKVRSNLQDQSFTELVAGSGNFAISSTTMQWYKTTATGTTDTDVDKWGWYVDLPRNGEKMTYDMTLYGKGLFFSTIRTSEDPCSAGLSGTLYAIDPNSGGRTNYVVFDMNGDGAFNAADGAGSSTVSGTQTGAGKQTIRAARVFDPSANAEKRVNSGVEFGRQSWRRQPAN
ncbi:pilus assembly protein [Xenophilus aerolatus]|nr:PilC/PilY family type IV pilus protein [Xenophilus aerolatus]